ncbi:MAG: alkaline phosphatase family protein [Sulfobacillus sp.]
MNNKLALVLVDGMAAYTEPALVQLFAAFKDGRLLRYPVNAAVPTLSYPNYATIISGEDPDLHGLKDNADRRRLKESHVMRGIVQQGGVVGTVAFSWWKDLVGEVGPGRFYEAEDTPDEWVFQQAEELVVQHNPDFLLIHPMGVDWAGHCFGGSSPNYLLAVGAMDALINKFWLWWREHTGGMLMVGADHGMGQGHMHDGNGPLERQIVYYLDVNGRSAPQAPTNQRDIRRVIETLMGLGD